MTTLSVPTLSFSMLWDFILSNNNNNNNDKRLIT